MDIITQDELGYLQEASARADQRVLDLLNAARKEDYFGPRLKIAGDMGDYVVPPILSWETLYEVVKDPTLGDIDFSIKKYPHFDGRIETQFHSDEFINPLNAKYEKWGDLRDNIACVRNYLFIHYFEQNPNNIAENKAEEMLEDIADFIGKGCYNNFLFLGRIPNHNPLEAFIDLEKASAPDGEGARYIYERILTRNRHNNWLRPIDAFVAFFTGKHITDWQLPDVYDTPFHPGYSKIVSDGVISEAMVDEAVAEAEHLRNLLSDAYRVRDEQRFMRNRATDLDALSNHMLYSAASAHHIAGLQEPVRRDAIEIAKEILDKLKVKFGNKNIQEGIQVESDDDIKILGESKSALTVYEKLIAHARSVNAGILNHPAVISATQAFGQLGYLAKLEAFRIARDTGDTQYAQLLADQLGRIPDYFAQTTHRTFGELIRHIETGMAVIIERVQHISGPASFLSTDMRETVGMSMATPTAGLQAQVAAAIGVQGNLQAQQANMAADQAARTQAARIISDQARQSGGQQAASNPVSSSGTGRSALAEAKKSTTQTSGSAAPIDSRLIRSPLAGSQAARKAQQNTPLIVNSQQQRGAAQGIPPLVLKAMQDAQIRAANITSSHHQDDHHHPNMLSNGLKPLATPQKADKQKDAPLITGPQTRAEEEERRRRAQAQQTLPGKPQGRTIF